jgi:hypothetical protein
MRYIKDLYHRLAGVWINDVVDEIKCSTTKVCEKVDELLARAQVDGEDYWFLQDNRKRPSGKKYNNRDHLTS